MNIGGTFKVFKKEFSICDYFRIDGSVPTIVISYSSDWAGCTSRISAVEANSEVKLAISNMHWHFSFRLLGFGVYVTRQWGY